MSMSIGPLCTFTYLSALSEPPTWTASSCLISITKIKNILPMSEAEKQVSVLLNVTQSEVFSSLQ